MTAAFGLVFGVVAKVQQRIQTLVSLNKNAASDAAVAAGRAAARYKFFTPKGGHAVSAIAGFNVDLYTVKEHFLLLDSIRRRQH